MLACRNDYEAPQLKSGALGISETPMHPLIAANEKYEELFSGWFKNLLAISVGTLTILVSLMPNPPIPAPERYPLAVCWGSLALSVLAALIASFRPVLIAKMNLHLQHGALDDTPEQPTKLDQSVNREIQRQMRLVVAAQLVAVCSFAIALVSLALFALLRTL